MRIFCPRDYCSADIYWQNDEQDKHKPSCVVCHNCGEIARVKWNMVKREFVALPLPEKIFVELRKMPHWLVAIHRARMLLIQKISPST